MAHHLNLSLQNPPEEFLREGGELLEIVLEPAVAPIL